MDNWKALYGPKILEPWEKPKPKSSWQKDIDQYAEIGIKKAWKKSAEMSVKRISEKYPPKKLSQPPSISW